MQDSPNNVVVSQRLRNNDYRLFPDSLRQRPGKAENIEQKVPLMSDGTISEEYLCKIFPNYQRNGIFVEYWNDSDGQPERTSLVINDGKVFPPEHGWHTRPEWAFEGPCYYLPECAYYTKKI